MTKEDLRKQFENCIHPTKKIFLTFCLAFGISLSLLTYIFHPSTFPKMFLLIIFSLLIGISFSSKHLRHLYDNLDQALHQLRVERSTYFEKYAVTTTDVIDDFTMSYTQYDVKLSFSYRSQSQSFTVLRTLIPQPYANQRLVIVAHHLSLPSDRIRDYEERFDLSEFSQTYATFIKRRERNLALFSSPWETNQSPYKTISELPATEKQTFELAIVNQLDPATNESTTKIK
ncbi:TPA: hypothetical protein U1C94_000035 [Streptococcus suis]|nr:hypothetical protein [Streptococcus suis]